MSQQVAVVGCGYWGPNLIRNFMLSENVEKIHCFDKDRARMETMRRRFPGTASSRDFDSILKNDSISVVAIATPVSTHFRLTKAALSAGKHVLVEKPLTDNSRHAEELIEIAEKKGVILMVDHTYLFTSAVRKIKELVDTGELGKLIYYDSTRVNLGIFRDVNVLWDLAVHDLSIIDNLFQAKPVSVACTGNRLEPFQQESIAFTTLNMDDGSLAHINVSWISPVKIRLTLIGGTERMVVFDDMEASEKVKVYDKGVEVPDDPEEIYHARVQYREGDMFAPRLVNEEALNVECRYLIESIERGVRPFNDGESGLRVIKVLEAATKSMLAGGTSVKVT